MHVVRNIISALYLLTALVGLPLIRLMWRELKRGLGNRLSATAPVPDATGWGVETGTELLVRHFQSKLNVAELKLY